LYNKRLAKAVLNYLHEKYPDSVNIGDIERDVPECSAADGHELLRVIDVLEAERKISGKFKRSLAGTMQYAAFLKLTPEGRRESEEPAVTDVELDSLLKIPNRGQYNRDFTQFCDEANGDRPLTLVVIDIDQFKSVNDQYGHSTGDEVLKQAAGALSSICEHKGRVYRYGGDEIVALLRNHTMDEALPIAERLRVRIHALRNEGNPPVVSASFGLATFPYPIKECSELFEAADQALYRAKQSGRNRVCTVEARANESD
jgi:diguanylate cyclase (GGDEF)-like protein